MVKYDNDVFCWHKWKTFIKLSLYIGMLFISSSIRVLKIKSLVNIEELYILNIFKYIFR
jgi:hypothetical protein